MSNDALRAEHDAVLAAVQTRASTLHFAHVAVSFFVAVSLGGTAGKLWWDQEPTSWWATAAALCGVTLVYCLSRLALALTRYRSERTQVDRLMVLRKQMGLDAPVSLPVAS